MASMTRAQRREYTAKQRRLRKYRERLKHLLATEARQVQTEEAYDGHLVLRLLAGLVLFYTARFCLQGRVTMEAIVFSLKHPWRFLSSEPLE
jgi:hypothetical protein